MDVDPPSTDVESPSKRLRLTLPPDDTVHAELIGTPWVTDSNAYYGYDWHREFEELDRYWVWSDSDKTYNTWYLVQHLDGWTGWWSDSTGWWTE